MDFKSLFDQAPFGMVVTTLKGNISLVNKSFCTMLGYSSEELLTMHYEDIVHPDYQKLYEQQIEVLRTGAVNFVQMATKCLSKQGEVIKVNYRANLLVTESDKTIEVVAEIAEVTELETGPFVRVKEDNVIYLNALMEHSPDLIYFKNRKSHRCRK